MQYKTTALIAVSLASSAAATGWLDQDAYSCPSNTDNKCSDSQQGGYDWSGLDSGSFSSYGSNSFSGFSCGNSYGKRDLLTKRTFQSKCIQGSLDDQPSMSCDSDDDKMSIDEMQISTSHDADVECEYGMPDGSTCRETHSCSSGGSVVKNSQCGGARSVTFKPGNNAPAGCSVGVHSIGFNCNSASSSVPAASTPAPSTSSYVMTPGHTSTTAYTTSSPACGYGDENCSSSATPSSLVSSSAASSGCAYGSTEEGCSSSATPSSPISTSSAVVPGCSYGEEGCDSTSSAPSTPATSATPSSPVSSSVSIESSSVASSSSWSTIGVPGYSQRTSSTPISPVSSSSVPGIPTYGVSTSSAPGLPATSSAPYPTSSSQGIPGYGTGSISSSTDISPVSSSSAPSYPAPSCPAVLPKCLKTWLHVTTCANSGDSDCFCKDAMFVKNVYECLPAWASNEEASAAASYLMGLCSPHIGSNPGIITACPSSVTPVATPSYTQPAVSSVPVSSAVLSAPISSAPAYVPSSSSQGSPIESSVPAYQPSSSSEGSLVESEVPPAYTPITHTYWSTAEVTITSCGPEITNCPASSTVVQTTSTIVVSVETTVAASTPYSPATTSPGAPPAYGSSAVESASSPVSPQTTSAAGAPPAYGSSAVESASTPLSPITTSAAGSLPAYSAPPGTAPAAAPSATAPAASSAPCTTVTFSSSVVAPATYSTGVSSGYEVPGSSYTTHLVTTITVPQVVMSTVTVTSNGVQTTSVGLGAGSPAPASATPTADAIGAYPPAGTGTGSAGWGTSYIPKPTGSSAPIQQVGNSGSKIGSSLVGLAFGAVAVVMAL